MDWDILPYTALPTYRLSCRGTRLGEDIDKDKKADTVHLTDLGSNWLFFELSSSHYSQTGCRLSGIHLCRPIACLLPSPNEKIEISSLLRLYFVRRVQKRTSLLAGGFVTSSVRTSQASLAHDYLAPSIHKT
ncbi:hypothetical protein K523DRAFT_106900 [Schizophyllum commune Tattone D]|nr:hypothetical protein K523DRAFT_106900 [Schizophyllum commune Tattone D]